MQDTLDMIRELPRLRMVEQVVATLLLQVELLPWEDMVHLRQVQVDMVHHQVEQVDTDLLLLELEVIKEVVAGAMVEEVVVDTEGEDVMEEVAATEEGAVMGEVVEGMVEVVEEDTEVETVMVTEEEVEEDMVVVEIRFSQTTRSLFRGSPLIVQRKISHSSLDQLESSRQTRRLAS